LFNDENTARRKKVSQPASLNHHAICLPRGSLAAAKDTRSGPRIPRAAAVLASLRHDRDAWRAPESTIAIESGLPGRSRWRTREIGPRGLRRIIGDETPLGRPLKGLRFLVLPRRFGELGSRAQIIDLSGGRTRTPTRDPLIKSQLLYHWAMRPNQSE